MRCIKYISIVGLLCLCNIALFAQETPVVPPVPAEKNTKRARLIRKKAFRKTPSESTTAPTVPSSTGSEELEESPDVIVPPVPEQ
ncbi:MAG TPA: hypothetical protein VKU36_00825 [Candidatus Babeliales bacterium]|nr:hypothetical protein [Candidatus Babeliales bacterium]